MENTSLQKIDLKGAAVKLTELEAKKEELTALVEANAGILVTEIDDKEGRARLKRARIDLRNAQIPIEKEAKAIRDEFNAANKYVSAKEKELCSIVQPLLDEYRKQEESLSEKEAEIEAEKKRRFDAKVNLRISEMRQYGMEVDSLTIGYLPDDAYAADLASAKARYEAERARIAEEKRFEEEERERIRLQGEAQEKERLRLQEEKAELERIYAEFEQIRREAAAAEKSRMEAEKKAEDDKREALERAEKEKQAAIEAVERKAREDADAKEKERLNALRLQAEEKERLRREAAAAPDKEKLLLLADAFDAVAIPELSTGEAKLIASQIMMLQGRLSKYIRTESNKIKM